jgi:hypothetical protein
VRDEEKLKLEVPISWFHEIRQDSAGAPPTILFKTKSPDSFLVLLTPIDPSRETVAAASDASIRRQVEESARKAEPSSVEKKLEVMEIRGASGRGYYFFATDPSPRPGTWKYMTQGILRIGELAVSFTILTNEGQNGVINDALRMLRNAKHPEILHVTRGRRARVRAGSRKDGWTFWTGRRGIGTERPE